jgi:hypothetical protein
MAEPLPFHDRRHVFSFYRVATPETHLLEHPAQHGHLSNRRKDTDGPVNLPAA